METCGVNICTPGFDVTVIYVQCHTWVCGWKCYIISECAIEREKRWGEEGDHSGSCAGDNPWTGSQPLKQKLLQLLWLNQIKKTKKIFTGNQGMHIIHRNAIAQCWFSLEHRERAQSDKMLWLSSLCGLKKKKRQASKYFISAFTHAILSVLKATRPVRIQV